MPDATSLLDSLTSIGSRTDDDMSKRDVENLLSKWTSTTPPAMKKSRWTFGVSSTLL